MKDDPFLTTGRDAIATRERKGERELRREKITKHVKARNFFENSVCSFVPTLAHSTNTHSLVPHRIPDSAWIFGIGIEAQRYANVYLQKS